MDNEDKVARSGNFSPTLIWTVESVVVAAAFSLGIYLGQAIFDKEKADYYYQMHALADSLRILNAKMDSIQRTKVVELKPVYEIFNYGVLKQGLNMGVNTSGNKTNWVVIDNNEMCMNYPGGQDFGSVFITVGKPSPLPRRAMDFSQYSKLLLELKAEPGATLSIALKDNMDEDDDFKSLYLITVIHAGWNSYEISLLENFPSADLKNLYVVTEFIFDRKPQNVCVRKIQFL